MRRVTYVTPALAAAALIARARDARATYPDVFGWGPEVVAHAGAGVADARDFSATFMNPAGLAFAEGSSLFSGLSYVGSLLEVRGVHRPIADPLGSPLGLVIRSRDPDWLSRHVALGLGAYVMPDTIVHIVTHLPGEPAFPYYENRTQRITVLPSIALRLHETLSIGLSMNFFAGLSGPAAARDGPTRAVETAITEEIYARAGVIAGVRFTPLRSLALALVYRQSFSVPYTIDTSNRVGGVPLDLSITASGVFTPDELVFGAAWTGGRWRLVGDVAYARWGAWAGPFVAVRASLPGLELAPALPDPGLRDTFAARAGATYRLPYDGALGIEFRAGAGFETSMVGDQPARTNLFDGDRVVLAAGGAIDMPPMWGVASRLGVAFQYHYVGLRTYTKQVGTPDDAARDPRVLADEDASRPGVQTTNPGYPSITGGGGAWTVIAGVEVKL